jgi:hypothetical protein
MVMQLLPCPHCAAGFSTHGELHTHGREAHRATTPKDDKLYGGASDAGFADQAERDAHEAEKHDKGIERIEKTEES